MKKYLLIDSNNLAARNAFSNESLMNSDGICTGAIYGVLNSLIGLKTRYPDYQFLMAWDGKSEYRLKLSKDSVEKGIIEDHYKSNRKDIPKPLADFYLIADYLKKGIDTLGIPQIRYENYEADDVLATYAKILGKDNEVILVTSDKDYYQMLSKNVSIYDGMKQQVITEYDFKNMTGLNPIQWVDVGALMGDACLSGKTKIKLLNGNDVTMEKLYTDGGEHWVYTSTIDGDIIPTKATCYLIHKNVNVIKITLDNQEEIVCTKDHRFMMRDGTYKEASCLRTSDSLMPFYYKESKIKKKDYLTIFNNKNKKWEYAHSIVASNYYRDKFIELKEDYLNDKTISKRVVIHHKDFNGFNNSPDNLEVMTLDDHISYHSSLNKEKWCDADYREFMKDVCSRAGKIGGARTWEKYRNKMLQVVGNTGKITGKINITRYNKSEQHRETARKSMHYYRTDEKFAESRSMTAKKNAAKNKYIKNHLSAIGTRNVLKMNGDGEYRLKQKLGRIQNIALKAFKMYGVVNKDTYSLCRTKNDILWENAIRNFTEEGINKKCFKNHKIVNIVDYGVEDVYDLHIIDNENHNFALSSGVFVHNCDHIEGVPGWGDKTAIKEVLKYGTVEEIISSYIQSFGHLRDKYPDLDKNNIEDMKKFDELKSAKSEKGISLYNGVRIDMPYSGVLSAYHDGKVKMTKTILMCLLFQDRIRLAYKLKKSIDDIPNLPEICEQEKNMERTMEFLKVYEINSLVNKIMVFFEEANSNTINNLGVDDENFI